MQATWGVIGSLPLHGITMQPRVSPGASSPPSAPHGHLGLSSAALCYACSLEAGFEELCIEISRDAAGELGMSMYGTGKLLAVRDNCTQPQPYCKPSPSTLKAGCSSYEATAFHQRDGCPYRTRMIARPLGGHMPAARRAHMPRAYARRACAWGACSAGAADSVTVFYSG